VKKLSLAVTVLVLAALFALPAFAQTETAPPAPTGVSAEATSTSSATLSWTHITSGCLGDVDYGIRIYLPDGNSHVVFTPIAATSYVFNPLSAGYHSFDIYSFCWSSYLYSTDYGEADVTIPTSHVDNPPTIIDKSLGVKQVEDLAATTSTNTITATWTSEAGNSAPNGYCDVQDYAAAAYDSSGNFDSETYGITTGTWTSGALTNDTYSVMVAGYSAECDAWADWSTVSVTVSN